MPVNAEQNVAWRFHVAPAPACERRPDLCCAKYVSAGERPNATQLTAIYKSWGEEERVLSSPTQLRLHALAACPAEVAALHSCRSESAVGLPPPPTPQRETAGFNIACGTRVISPA